MISLIRSRTARSLLRCGVIVASLALATDAFAANESHVAVNSLRSAHVTQTRAAARNRQPVAQIFQGLFGLPISAPVTSGSARDTVSLAPIGHAMAQTAPQVMYKDIVRPNGQKRRDAVYQADVGACRQQTGGSPYLPDSVAMKKCMLSDGFQFMWQRGFGSGSSGAVTASSVSSDYDYTPPPDTSAQDAIGWAAQQSAIDALNQAAAIDQQESDEMTASMAATAAQNALDENMINQDTMNQLNNQ